MRQRCYLPSDNFFADYGGRGIEVCDEWKRSFQSFMEWAIENGYDDAKYIDRIDVHGHYQPSNCRFVTPKESARNTRHNVVVVAFGESKCLSAWGDDYRSAVRAESISKRLKAGWKAEDAISLPAGARPIHEPIA